MLLKMILSLICLFQMQHLFAGLSYDWKEAEERARRPIIEAPCLAAANSTLAQSKATDIAVALDELKSSEFSGKQMVKYAAPLLVWMRNLWLERNGLGNSTAVYLGVKNKLESFFEGDRPKEFVSYKDLASVVMGFSEGMNHRGGNALPITVEQVNFEGMTSDRNIRLTGFDLVASMMRFSPDVMMFFHGHKLTTEERAWISSRPVVPIRVMPEYENNGQLSPRGMFRENAQWAFAVTQNWTRLGEKKSEAMIDRYMLIKKYLAKNLVGEGARPARLQLELLAYAAAIIPLGEGAEYQYTPSTLTNTGISEVFEGLLSGKTLKGLTIGYGKTAARDLSMAGFTYGFSEYISANSPEFLGELGVSSLKDSFVQNELRPAMADIIRVADALSASR